MPLPLLITAFRVFPSFRSWSSLEATSFLVVIDQRALTNWPDRIACGFPDAHALERGCLVPPTDYELPFHERGARFPVTPDQDQQNRHVPPASPTSKPSSRFESVRVFPSCPGPTVVTLLTFLPAEFVPRTSELMTRPASRAGNRLSPLGSSPSDLGDDSGDQQPPQSGEDLVARRTERFDPLSSTRRSSATDRATSR